MFMYFFYCMFKAVIVLFFLKLLPGSVDPPGQLVTDYGFEDHFNHGLKVEEKKNRQNRIVAPREAPPPPTPPLPPRKGSYTPSVAPAAGPPPKDRPPQLQMVAPVRLE